MEPTGDSASFDRQLEKVSQGIVPPVTARIVPLEWIDCWRTVTALPPFVSVKREVSARVTAQTKSQENRPTVMPWGMGMMDDQFGTLPSPKCLLSWSCADRPPPGVQWGRFCFS